LKNAYIQIVILSATSTLDLLPATLDGHSLLHYLEGLLGRENIAVKATSSCRHIRIQVRPSLLGVCRIQLGIAGKTFPLQDSAVSIYSHSCQALDGEALRPDLGLAGKGSHTGCGLEDVECDPASGFGPGDLGFYIGALPA
jgi:hypothetical protein